MSTKFFTNQQDNTLFNKFKGVFEYNKTINNFDVLVGYFRSSGYFKLRLLLEDVANIRILVGIDVDKITKQMQAVGLDIFKGNPEEAIKSWQERFKNDIAQAKYDAQTEQGIKQFVTDISSGKVSLKAHPSQKIHAKIYIFRPDDFNQHHAGSVVTGSSNLTDSGLGIKTSSNYEFNVLLNDYDDVQFATLEFERLWDEGVEILPEKATESLKNTYLSDDITPYELYLKCLIEYFGSEVEFDPNSIKALPSDLKRLSYQMDAVNEGQEILKKHNGFFLSDVVGLGKTIIATLIARQFLLLNQHTRNPIILLIIPPGLRQNWEDTLENFEIKGMVEIFTNGSLHKVENAEKYDMVIVDEAHRFRNNTSAAYGHLQIICKTKTEAGKHKKVMLISATPLNNRPDDIYNQILLFQDGNNSTLDFPLADFFSKVKREYLEILKSGDKTSAAKKTKLLYNRIRERVIAPLMVRRTRTDLLANDRYKEDLRLNDVVFPETTPPQPIYYQLARDLEVLYDDTIEKIGNKKQDKTGLLHTRYRALHYLKPEFKKQYKGADSIAERLAALMKTLLLKRMDSSFYAFKQTLERFIQSSETMLKMIDNNNIIIAPNLDIETYVLADEEEGLMRLIENERLTDPSIITCTKDDFEPGFVDGIEHDYQMLKNLNSKWDEVITDPKVEEFLTRLPDFLAKKDNPEQKLIIFTESVDTAEHLRLRLTEYGEKLLSINAKNRNKLKGSISANFDANLKEECQKNDYQLIITTDVLAEGVNLHRANTVVNYDTPWNATKLMQRIGRVNRIGQRAKRIFVYNFYPTEQINDDIGLEKRAIIKLQAFHSALGEDSQIYSTDEQVGTFGIFDGDIQEEKNEIIPFLEEIRKFKEEHPPWYQRIKNLPSKVRNAVNNAKHKNSTVVFARTKDKGSSRFYLVKDKVEDYGFIKTAGLLKCPPDTQAQSLHEKHYPQVGDALGHFEAEITQNITNRNQNKSLTSYESKAIKFLKALIALPHIEPEKKEKLNQALRAIEDKRFQKLTRDINKLSKNSKNIEPRVILEKCLNIISESGVKSPTKDNEAKQQEVQNTQPSVVISQSYT